MRKTIFAIALTMPMAAFAQSAESTDNTLILTQSSCSAGMVWDSAAGACVNAPSQSTAAGGHPGCGSMKAAREVMS